MFDLSCPVKMNGLVGSEQKLMIYVEGVTLVLPSRPFMFNKYWRILALS